MTQTLLKYNQINGAPVNVFDYGVVGDGTTDDSTALAAAIATGKNLYIPDGTYLCGGIKITTDYQSVTFSPNVILKANANNVILFHQAASHAKHSGRFRTDSNSKTGVWGMACAPADLTQTTTLVQNNFNDMPGIFGDPGLDECIVFQCGPDVGGAESGCFYNNVPHSQAQGAKRMLWLKNATNANASSVNRNKFYNLRAGTFGGIGCNTGIQIDAGSTNSFFACDFEGVGSNSAATPNAVPTAVKILAAAASSGADNNNNRFFSGTCEACTRDVDNANQYTEFYGFGFLDSLSLFTAKPFISLGGTGPSANLLRLMGVEQTDGITLELVDIADFSDTGKKWQSYPLTTSNMIHSGGTPVTSVLEYQSKYWQLSGMVHWSFRVQFQAANTNAVEITLPVPEEINQYSLFSNIPEMRFTCVVNDGVTEIVTIGQFVTGQDKISINHSGLWDTAGTNNRIWVQCLLYHKA